MSDPCDRSAILARRMFLVSSALASLQCAPAKTDPSTPSAEPSASTEPPPSGSAVGSTSAPRDPEAPPAPQPISWKDQLLKAPARLDLSKMPEDAQRSFGPALAEIDAAYTALAALYEPGQEPSCPPNAVECRDLWRARLAKVKAVQQAIEAFGPGLCGGDEQIRLFEAHVDAHQAFVQTSFQVAVEYYDGVADSFGLIASQAWRKRETRPDVSMRPCLSCLAPARMPIGTAFTFPRDAATLDKAQEERAQEVLDSTKGWNPTSIELWAHAGPEEKDPLALSKKRGDAVAAALVKRGFDTKRVKVVPLGAGLAPSGTVEIVIVTR